MVSLEFLKEQVRQKPELASLSAPVVEEAIVACLRKHRVSAEALAARDARLIVKEVRQGLRMLAGRYQHPVYRSQRPVLLAARRYRSLLLTHASTASRIADYALLKRELKKRRVASILDLGSGLNPIALATPGVTYYALDIREDDLSLVAAFFHQEQIAGTTLVCDLRKNLPSLPFVDACLLMNVLDVVETQKPKGHKRAEEIIASIQAKYFFITFSTKTLSGSPMRHPQRGWIERLLTRRGFLWKRISLSTEVLYIAQAPDTS